jgi:hypothetical protein
MTNADYPESLSPSNPTLTAAEHLALAGVLLEKQASDVLSGWQAGRLKDLAAIFAVLALKLEAVAQAQRRPA